ncbi:hypothetical protein J3458_014366 [Metarhizium acridum]|uniref:Uncharacterized protein n=1 Tax=Metarhizium acridum (strain CQMa 102) TaxID=655827 RepID=E9E3R7_METAQ|nr:uncharacterized protein MAC_04511 [Metarhizium acridum CQMa 102]EFY89492.1 hypothetical protein MAC_04511 [Metarhizium acridum CQMa 102]KAG8412173.1 hypothetical protein J3458_014366 [Metarhizium acridum]
MSGAARVLKYMWHRLNKKGSKFNHKVAEQLIQDTVNYDLQQPYGDQLRRATTVEEVDTPHESKHIIDGHVYVDPMHAKFKLRNEKDKRITTAHYYYPEPLGGRHVWYSKESLNGGASSSAYWVYEGPVDQASSSRKGKEKSKK